MKKSALNSLGVINPQLLVVLAVIGLVAYFAIASTAPFKEGILNVLYPKQPSFAATTWAFEENWDSFGTPTSPLPYKNPAKFDIVISSNNTDGVVDGQVLGPNDTSLHPPVEAAHGSDCGAPINRGDLNIHKITTNFDELGFQTETRPQLAFICNKHLMTTIKSGYALASIMPRQYFDFAGRMGTIELDTGVFGFGREWFDMYLLPEEDMLQSMATLSEGGTLEQMPRSAIKISFRDAKPTMYFIENYNSNDTDTRFFRSGYQFKDAFPNDPAPNDPSIRRKFRFQVSQTSWKYQIQLDINTTGVPEGTMETIDGVKYWTYSGNFPKPLPFSRAVIRLEHHSYNPTKDGIFGEPWSQYTQHWDNFHFDGPVIPTPTAFEPTTIDFVKMWGAAPGTISSPMKFNVNVAQSDIKNAKLVGEVASNFNREEGDLTNSGHWRQFRINGGAWQDSTLVKNVSCGCDRSWSTFRNSISGVVSGQNTVEFRYATRPNGLGWFVNGFNIKDVEIQIDPVGGVVPPTAPPTVPPTSPAVTPTPGGVATPPPSVPPTVPPSFPGTITVTFDDLSGQNQALTGQYPAGVADWGTGAWLNSGPYGQLNTKNISFNGGNITSASVALVTPRPVVSVDAFNGGSNVSTISLACAGQTTRSFTVNANTLQRLTTNWTTNCSNLTVTSSNGWDTNFDSLILGSIGGGGVTTPAPTPTPVPATPTPRPATPTPTAVPTVPPTVPPTPAVTPPPTLPPTAPPTTPPVTLAITTSATVSPTTIVAGSSLAISAKVTANRNTTQLVDVEIFDNVGNKVFQQYYDNQALSTTTKTYNMTWAVPNSSTAGKYFVTVGVFGNGWNGLVTWNGSAANFTVTRPVIVTAPPPQLPSPSVTTVPQGGLPFKGEYFNNMALTGTPLVVRNDTLVNFNYGTGAPIAGLPVNRFSIRWTGTMTVPTTGLYTFYTTTDDGVRLYVNNVLGVSRWNDQLARTFSYTTPAALTAGQKIPVVMEYFDNAGVASAVLEISGPNLTRRVMSLNP